MQKKFASILTIFLIYTLFLSVSSLHASSQNTNHDSLNIIIDGTNLKPNSSAIVLDDIIYVPIRSVFEQIGAKIGWLGETRTVTVSMNNINASVNIDQKESYLNNQLILLDSPAKLIKSTTYVPISFLVEFFEYDVSINGDTNSLEVNTSKHIETNEIMDDSKFEIISISATSETTIEVSFNHLLDKKTAEDINNYSISQSTNVISISNATLDITGKKVVLTTTESQAVAVIYRAVIENVKDAKGNVIERTEKTFGSGGKSLKVQSISSTSIELVFDVELKKESAEDINNYSIINRSNINTPLLISTAELDISAKIVKITFTNPAIPVNIYLITSDNLQTIDGTSIPKRTGMFAGINR